MTKAEKAKNLRYKKAIVSQLNFEEITSQLYDISSVCEEYQYYFSGDDDTLLNALDGNDRQGAERRLK